MEAGLQAMTDRATVFLPLVWVFLLVELRWRVCASRNERWRTTLTLAALWLWVAIATRAYLRSETRELLGVIVITALILGSYTRTFFSSCMRKT